MKPARLIFITSLLLFFLSQILFLVHIQFPRTHNFDEFHYVPAAKELIAQGTNRNWEHPPLGKRIISWGILALGDRPIGWRFMSAFFGSLTLVGMYLWAFALFRRQDFALWVALLTLCNHLLYVQARIAMLDTFLFAFTIWALAAFTAAWDAKLAPRRVRTYLALTGVLLGLATASKWSGVLAWGACIGLVVFVRLFQLYRRKAGATGPTNGDSHWCATDLWKGVGVGIWVLCLGIIPLAVYFVCFVPLLESHFLQTPFAAMVELLSMQKRMWDGQLRVITAHPYMSQWWEWVLLKRPIWYAFDRETDGSVRGVLLLGNPLVMWTGVVAVFFCLWDWLRKGDRAAFLIFAFYAAFTVSWLVIPRKVSFYYYYYPSGMVLSCALALLFQKLEARLSFPWPRYVFLGAAAALFIYFFPILSALKIPSEVFRRWMWFSGWI